MTKKLLDIWYSSGNYAQLTRERVAVDHLENMLALAAEPGNTPVIPTAGASPMETAALIGAFQQGKQAMLSAFRQLINAQDVTENSLKRIAEQMTVSPWQHILEQSDDDE